MSIAFINGTTGQSSATTSLTLTYTPTAGNTIVIAICDLGGSFLSTPTCADNNGNSLTLVVNHPATGGYQFVGLAIVGATSYKLSWTGNASIPAALGEYSGATGTAGASGTNTSVSATVETISITTTGTNSWIVAGIANQGFTQTASVGTIRETSSGAAGNLSLVDNTAVSSGSSVTNTVTIAVAHAFDASAVELIVGSDFTIAASPNIAIPGTGSGSTTITVAGGNANVTLSVTSGLPAGATAVFSTNPITGGSGTSTLTITNAAVAYGTYTIIVQGVEGGFNHTTTFTLTSLGSFSRRWVSR